MKPLGAFIIIEGTDGSGKGTQCDLLVQRLREEGGNPLVMDFPRYGQPSAYFVEKYLTGGYGTIRDTGPERASFFYALDRFDASPAIWEALRAGRMVIANRYVASSMGHQGSKMETREERRKYFEWLYDLEYRIFGIPKPAKNIILHVPAKVSFELVKKKAERKYLEGGQKDIHENDIDHLERAEATYKEMAELFPEEFTLITCAPEGQLLSIEAIHELIWAEVKKLV